MPKPSKTRRVAIIGHGAAALGVLDGLDGGAGLDVTVFAPARREPAPYTPESPDAAIPPWRDDAQNRYLKHRLGLTVPPPKTEFGATPEKRVVHGWGDVWWGGERDGLTRYWGASALPYTDRDLAGWPVGRAELEPHYRAVAGPMGITGADDPLRVHLADDFAEMPEAAPIDPIGRLIAGLGGSVDGHAVIPGAARLALDTRAGSGTGCVRCGRCMTGCPRASVFNAGRALAERLTNAAVIDAEVTAIDPAKGSVTTAHDGVHRGFDAVFLAAGCLASTAIMMRSLGLTTGPTVTDNALFTFPIVRKGPPRLAAPDYVALTNGLAVVAPEDETQASAFVQIYPTADGYWQYYLPRPLWPLMSPLGRLARASVMWGRLYLHSDRSQAYRAEMKGDRLVLDLARGPDESHAKDTWMPVLAKAFSKAGAWVPSGALIAHKTSSHYAGSFPMGGDHVDAGGKVGDRLYLCDAANFPTCPAPSHTLTMMANARRIAADWLRRI